MSADAKVWYDSETLNGRWQGLHDGECEHPNSHWGTSYQLREVLESVETCMGQSLWWKFRTYPDGQVGLVGYYA